MELFIIPDEILYNIFLYLPLRDMINLSSTSSKMYNLIMDKKLWINKFEENNIPTFALKQDISIIESVKKTKNIYQEIKKIFTENRIIRLSLKWIPDPKYLYVPEIDKKIVDDLFVQRNKNEKIHRLLEKIKEIADNKNPSPDVRDYINNKYSHTLEGFKEDWKYIFDVVIEISIDIMQKEEIYNYTVITGYIEDTFPFPPTFDISRKSVLNVLFRLMCDYIYIDLC